MRPWQAMLIGAAALVGCGVFFATQNLGRADAYAIIASFFLALLTAAASLYSFTRSRAKEQADRHDSQRRHGTTNIARGNETVVQGNENDVHITRIVMQQPSKRRSQKN